MRWEAGGAGAGAWLSTPTDLVRLGTVSLLTFPDLGLAIAAAANVADAKGVDPLLYRSPRRSEDDLAVLSFWRRTDRTATAGSERRYVLARACSHMHTSVVAAQAARAPAARYLSCLRLHEIIILQGSPLLGAAVALRHLTMEHLGPLAILTVANLFLVAHIFALNDWSNLTTDLADPNKAAGVFTARGVGRREMAGLAIGLLVLSLLLFTRVGPGAFAVALGITALSALYSLPGLNWKGRPLLNSMAHLAGGTLHFLLGYGLATSIDRRGLVTAIFFGLTFAAGHLTQELRDYHGDSLNTIRTNAVSFGQHRTFAASLALFTLAQALLLFLALQGTLPRALAAIVLLYPIHVRWSLQTLSEGLTTASICRLQARYRALYGIVGLAMVAALWLD